jgi:ureidoglycolate hydrolase
VKAVRISAEGWAPFGWLPLEDTNPGDGEHRLAFEWEDPHVNVIKHRADEIARRDGALVCSEMFRHLTHTQVLLVLEVPAVVAVAPASVAFRDPADSSSVQAFLLEPLDALVLERGTWHWGPFPLGGEPVRLFNVQGLRYAEDNTRVDLEAMNASVEVLVPPTV